jgi:hypothetical protein
MDENFEIPFTCISYRLGKISQGYFAATIGATADQNSTTAALDQTIH